jgi:hypothetical protein
MPFFSRKIIAFPPMKSSYSFKIRTYPKTTLLLLLLHVSLHTLSRGSFSCLVTFRLLNANTVAEDNIRSLTPPLTLPPTHP